MVTAKISGKAQIKKVNFTKFITTKSASMAVRVSQTTLRCAASIEFNSFVIRYKKAIGD